MLRVSRSVFFCAVFIPLSLFFSCVKSSNPVAVEEFGTIEIRARVVNRPLAKTSAVNETVADSIILEISGADLAPVRIGRRVDLTRLTFVETVTGVPVGRNRRVEVWAVDRGGRTTHIDSLESRVVDIAVGTTAPIFVTLIPAAGSIYLYLFNPPGTSIRATFTNYNGMVIAENTVGRADRTFISLDNIPHGAEGVLRVEIIEGIDEIVYIATQEMTFCARSDNIIELQFFANSGALEIEVAMYMPGVTASSHNFNNHIPTAEKTGELIITEIMWHASADNYLELYNTTGSEQFFDSLIIIVNNTRYSFPEVRIAPHSYFVIGRQPAPHINAITTNASNNFISGSNGNWITVMRLDGTLINRVIHETGTATSTVSGWPGFPSSPTARRSIQLSKDHYCHIANNFGKNWFATPISDSTRITTNRYGTPGR